MKLPPANRVVATIGIIAGAAGAAAPAIAGLDTSSVVGVLGGLLVIGGIVDRYLKGSQQFDALQAQTATAVGPVTEPDVVSDVDSVEDPEADDFPIEELPSDEEELASPPPDDPDEL